MEGDFDGKVIRTSMVLLFVVLTSLFFFNGRHYNRSAGTKTIKTIQSVARADDGRGNTRTVAQVVRMDAAQLCDCTGEGYECKVNESCPYMRRYGPV